MTDSPTDQVNCIMVAYWYKETSQKQPRKSHFLHSVVDGLTNWQDKLNYRDALLLDKKNNERPAFHVILPILRIRTLRVKNFNWGKVFLNILFGFFWARGGYFVLGAISLGG